MPTLLFVDDEPHVIDALKRLLRREHYDKLYANNGQQGLALLDDNQVDVILSDQRMPNMLGSEFLAQAKQKQPNSKRIILSGYSDSKEIIYGLIDGSIHHFLAKPWRANELRKTLQDAFQPTSAKPSSQQTQTLAFSCNYQGTFLTLSQTMQDFLQENSLQDSNVCSLTGISSVELNKIFLQAQERKSWHQEIKNPHKAIQFELSLTVLKESAQQEQVIYGGIIEINPQET